MYVFTNIHIYTHMHKYTRTDSDVPECDSVCESSSDCVYIYLGVEKILWSQTINTHLNQMGFIGHWLLI